MTVFYLVRHGTMELGAEDAADQLFSVGNRGLSPRGREEAGAVRDLLADVPLDAVASSPMARCRETADIVAEAHDLEVRVHEDLVELAFHERDREPSYEEVLGNILEFARGLVGGEDPALPGGATWSEVVERVTGALEEVGSWGEHVAVVAHGGVNRVVLAHALDVPPGRVFDMEQDHGCVNVLEHRGGRRIVRLMNMVPGRLPRGQV